MAQAITSLISNPQDQIYPIATHMIQKECDEHKAERRSAHPSCNHHRNALVANYLGELEDIWNLD